MRRTLLGAALALAAACGGENEKPAVREGAATPPKAEPAPQTEDAGSQAPAVDPRQARLEAEWSLYADTVLSHSAAELPEGEKAMLRHLLDAAVLIEELHMLQIHPKNLEWRDRIEAEGTEVEKRIFSRYQSPWCADDPSEECCALPEKPKREIGFGLWPDGFSDAEYEGLAARINGVELLSPFTIVRRKEVGKYEAIPYVESDIFGFKMKSVAASLREAAKTAPHKSLVKFLTSRADAFESAAPFPWDASDYDWIALEGPWEITIGPYETYKEPRQLKALFEMVIARENPEITAELARFKGDLQSMEDALSARVGPEIYKSRKLDPRIAIRAVEVWMAAGDGRRDRGATVAYHLPNRGRSVDEGLYKKVMMVNHSLAFEPVSKARARLVLDPTQVHLVDAMADIRNVTFHELAHGFGAYSELKVKNAKGVTLAVKEALQENDSILEELKADTAGLWLVAKSGAEGEEAKKRYASGVVHALGLLQYPLEGTYPRMVAIQLGWLLDHGALAWDGAAKRFRIDFDRMPAAVEALVKRVATIQLTGDTEGARALVGAYVVRKGEAEYALQGALDEARRVMIAELKTAGIKSPSLRYAVTGL
ncbi:MAG: hypothetical protein M0R80_27195 [Proteobacteria bacterium]|jgi:hypothetical protein|nr:hypothetical protein [Pseudomonadota bacterium]